ncbi:MAG: hypothetical protein KGJ50_10190 [Xanthomonadaceae bacterium]|nr:hypothetical protein [Xanthomonadaceae bacterium]MDE2245222.1 hypothetical protein [Xanthomonadaceae bacterium]
MRAALKLALLPLRIAPWAAVAIALLIGLGGVLSTIGDHPAPWIALLFAAVGLWFLWLLAGVGLKGIARKETLLLPDFTRALALAGAAWGLLFWLAPCLIVAALYGLRPAWTALGGGAAGAAWAILSSSGSRSSLWIWVLIIGARFVPPMLWTALEPALTGAGLPLAGLLLAALLLRLTWQRLFPAGDPPLPESPLAAPDPMRRGVGNDTPSVAHSRLVRRLHDWSGEGAGTRLRRRASRYHAAPSPARERSLLRALLLPHEQPRGWLVRWLLFGIFVAVYALALGHGAQLGMVAGYATFFAMTGLNTIGAGMPRLQPSLVELYFTLAPPTRADFKTALVDSFLGVLPGAILGAFVYTLLAALLIDPTQWLRVLTTTAILAPPLALGTLALYLNLPGNVILRTVVTIITVFGQMGAYWTGYVLLARLGPLWGGVPTLVLTWGFAIGAWTTARRLWIGNPLSFDPPRAKAGG